VEWHRLEHTRPFIDRTVNLTSVENVTETLLSTLPEDRQGAIIRLIVNYPRAWSDLIDEPALRRQLTDTFEFHLILRPQMDSRIRLSAEQTISSQQPIDLLHQYFQAEHVPADEMDALDQLARQVLSEDQDDSVG
jgi:hypothetical protein